MMIGVEQATQHTFGRQSLRVPFTGSPPMILLLLLSGLLLNLDDCTALCIARRRPANYFNANPGQSRLQQQQQQQPPKHLSQRAGRRSTRHRLSSPLQDESTIVESFHPPLFKKHPVETKFITSTLSSNFLFQHLPKAVLNQVVHAFEKVEYNQGSVIIQQADLQTDFLYIIGNGDCSVSINGRVLVDPFGTMSTGSIVGELGILYNTARAATITAKSKKVTLYRLDRKSFAYFIYQRGGPIGENMMHTTTTPGQLKTEVRAIDQAIDNIAGVKSRYGGTIVRTFDSSRRFLWRRWVGTILQHAWKATLANVGVSVVLSIVLRVLVPHTWGMFMTPNAAESALMARLATFGRAWQYLMSLTTFILTFFLSEAYSVWRDTFESIRTCQGRLNDVGLLLAAAAKRESDGTYTKQAGAMLDDVATYSRLFGAFMVANFCKPYRVLVSSRGLSRMLSRGLLTERQYMTLRGLDPSVSPHIACLEWITARCLEGVSEYNALRNPTAVQEPILDKLTTLRGSAGSLADSAFIHGRMPLSYVHFVQVLVDTFLIAAPFALYAELGEWSILAVGILTLFYSGLLDLSKMFLDPLDNEDHYQSTSINIDMGVLIREINAGSTRWKLGAEQLPFRVKGEGGYQK
jgi:CRP-like cAMP-binding protein